MSDEKDTNFKVSDRRKFNPDGTPREQFDEAPEPVVSKPAESQPSHADNVISFPGEGANKKEASEPGPVASIPPPKASANPAPRQAPANQAQAAPNELFISLLNMLGVEAAMYLGLIESPGEQQIPIDIEAARRMIDLLAVLQEKTAGNLAPQESAMLEGVLNDLRMHYVALSRKQ